MATVRFIKDTDVVYLIDMEGYCLKCKQKREIADGEESVTERGMRMMKGKCSVCGTKVAKILGKA